MGLTGFFLQVPRVPGSSSASSTDKGEPLMHLIFYSTTYGQHHRSTEELANGKDGDSDCEDPAWPVADVLA
jgi:hypothetical protein